MMTALTTCRVVALGNVTAWGKNFLLGLQNTGLLEIDFESSIERFVSSGETLPQLVFIENCGDNRAFINTLRQSDKKFYLMWFGRVFTKEDLSFAIERRIYCIYESVRPEDPQVQNRIRSVVMALEGTRQVEILIRSLKSILLQAEGDMAEALMVELKTVVAKLEKHALYDEFSGGAIPIETSGENRLLFNRADSFADALTTVHALERTGSLWVKGELQGQEGRIDFLQGKIIGAIAGDTKGLKAIYRIFLWDIPRFLFARREADECNVEDNISLTVEYICLEGDELNRRYNGIRQDLPPDNLFLELEPKSVHLGTTLTPMQFHTLASVVEYSKVSNVLDYNDLSDVVLYEGLIDLRKFNLIRIREEAPSSAA